MTATAEKTAVATAKNIRTGQQKLNILAQMIAGMPVATALNQLTFSNRRVAKEVKKCLQSAIANAENNNNMNVDNLVVAQAWTGKSIMMKRFRAGAKGRGMRIEKPFCRLTIVLKEQQ
jgi:large subunit ribosomal protein L22